jgi:hypothetical protein
VNVFSFNIRLKLGTPSCVDHVQIAPANCLVSMLFAFIVTGRIGETGFVKFLVQSSTWYSLCQRIFRQSVCVVIVKMGLYVCVDLFVCDEYINHTWLQSLRIKKFTKYQPPCFYRSLEINMFIMSKNRTSRSAFFLFVMKIAI